jgi:hypothetical protein
MRPPTSAPTSSRTCSADVALAMGAFTDGRWSCHASATWATVVPCFFATEREVATRGLTEVESPVLPALPERGPS